MFSSGMDLNDLRDLSQDPSGAAHVPPPAAGLVEPARGDAQADDLPDPRRGAWRRVRARRWPATSARWPRTPWPGSWRCASACCPTSAAARGCRRVVGLGNAKELIMTGKVIDGREAHRIGFANRIAPADELDAHRRPRQRAAGLRAAGRRARQAGARRGREAGAGAHARAGGGGPGDARRERGLRGGRARLLREARPGLRRALDRQHEGEPVPSSGLALIAGSVGGSPASLPRPASAPSTYRYGP